MCPKQTYWTKYLVVFSQLVTSQWTLIQKFWFFLLLLKTSSWGPRRSKIRDPLYFEVHIFSDPPYMCKNAQNWYFLVVPLKTYPKVGVHRENFNIGNVAQFFFSGFYMLGLCHFIFATISNVKVFTVTVNVTVTVVPRTLKKVGKSWRRKKKLGKKLKTLKEVEKSWTKLKNVENIGKFEEEKSWKRLQKSWKKSWGKNGGDEWWWWSDGFTYW